MSNPDSELALHIGLSVVLGVAVIGFFVGVASPAGEAAPEAEAPAFSGDAPPALSYAEKRLRPPGAGPSWEYEAQKFAGPGVLDPVDLTGLDKGLAIEDRAAHRAYDGAPPTIPHTVRQNSAAECLACHDAGLRIRDRLAPPMSHELYPSCTQCHVVEEGPVPGELLPPDATFAANRFVGLESPTAGARAWDIAPPTIPHSTQNRERCMSCHGPNGRDPLRSSHPDRSSCTQCHASSAELDRSPGLQP